ncbi:MAG: 30S ribosomal protein S5, partial [Clostridia bacterium]|nr:30S ribosomal protein S5 [Clostridia bacterium]
IIAGGKVKSVLQLAGISDIRAKCLGTNNPGNVVKATFEGLRALRSAQEVAEMRGKTTEEILN